MSARRLLVATALLILLVFALIVWAPESSRDDDVVPWIVAALLGTLIALESLWRGVTLRRLLTATAIFALLFGMLAFIENQDATRVAQVAVGGYLCGAATRG